MLDVDVPHIYYLHVYGPDGLSTEIGFLMLDEISSIVKNDTDCMRRCDLVIFLSSCELSIRNFLTLVDSRVLSFLHYTV